MLESTNQYVYYGNRNKGRRNKNKRDYRRRNRRNRKNKKKYIVYLLIIIFIILVIVFGIQRLKGFVFDANEKTSMEKNSSASNSEPDEPEQTSDGETLGEEETVENEETIEEATVDEESLEENNTEKETKELDSRSPVKVKGIYVTGPMAGTKNSMQDLIHLVETTELNAMVIDIKNDSGEITYKMDIPDVMEIEAGVNYIRDIDKLVSELKAKDIYLIARIVAFKDPILAEMRPELSIKNADGTIFRDAAGLSWVNPYKKEVWDYLLSIATEAVRVGFDEIQFDYIRFSTDTKMNNVDFGDEAKEKSKVEVITEFTKYACDNLKPLGVFVSADVYGTIIDNKVDADIVGQDYVEMAKYLDYICPMIYPSHYGNGRFGIEYPDLEPYNVIFQALSKSKSALEKENTDNMAVVRSWLQDFTASWQEHYISYGKEEIRAQIDALYDAGYEEWILWNGKNNYTEDGLLPEEE